MAGRPLMRTLARSAAALLAAAASWPALAGIVYWMEPRSNVVLDAQVAQAIAPTAGLVVLRADWESPVPDYTLAASVQRMKSVVQAPVLAYSWANRWRKRGRSEGDLLRGLDTGRPLAEREDERDDLWRYLDVNDPALRSRIVSRYVGASRSLGVDGFALDGSIRTPMAVPKELAQRCEREPGFCERYAAGMDSLYGEIRAALGPRSYLLFNGLRHAAQGQVEDQLKLYASMNAASVEFFGRAPASQKYRFAHDIHPFLKVMEQLPQDKAVVVFGRGPWRYNDYAQDYAWQRYLYASYLLAARPVDHFKYLASFQVPAERGRTGGLDIFADWRIDLGKPRGPAEPARGLQVRRFERALVLVAPDDRNGGSFPLDRTWYTPEGRALSGTMNLEPGTGMILLASPAAAAPRGASRTIGAAEIARWGWRQATPEPSAAAARRLRLDPLPPALLGEHDLMLDWERSLQPYQRVRLDAQLLSDDSRMYVVAEVDDRERQVDTVVFEVTRGSPGAQRLDDAVQFRSPPKKVNGEQWPRIPLRAPTAGAPLALDGPALLDNSPYRFRRWSHVRFEGPVSVSEVVLSAPAEAYALPAATAPNQR